MRLATRCPSCTTMFLVVPDQLRVSDGWVRCGRCGNVFNAGESLLDVDTGIPARLDLGGPAPPAVHPTDTPAEPAAPEQATDNAPAPAAAAAPTAAGAAWPAAGEDVPLGLNRPTDPARPADGGALPSAVSVASVASVPSMAPSVPAPVVAGMPAMPAASADPAPPQALPDGANPGAPAQTTAASASAPAPQPEAPATPGTALPRPGQAATPPWPALSDDEPDDSARLDQWDIGLPTSAHTAQAPQAKPPAHPAPPEPISTPAAQPHSALAADPPPSTEDARWHERTVLLGELADEVELDSDVTDPWAPPEPTRSTPPTGRPALGPESRDTTPPDTDTDTDTDADSGARARDAAEPPEQLLRSPSLHFQSSDLAAEAAAADSWSELREPAPAGKALRQAHTTDPGPSTGGPLLNEVPPSFVRHAERAAFWRSRPVRIALGVLALVLAPLALLQAALVWRDPLAARVPALAQPLAAACAPLGCSLQPLRRIGQLSVEGSALDLLEDTPGPDGLRYRLNLQLRNRADVPLMAPAVELALTDARGELVSRRVLRMGDFGARAPDTLAAQEELSLRLVLAAGPHRIEGYTVDLFYP